MVLAMASFNQGNMTQSLIYSQELAQRGQAGADLQTQCWGLYTQGRAQWRLGNFDQAIASLQEAIQIAEAIPSHGVLIGASGDLAQCHLRQGQLEKALSTLQICQKLYIEHSVGWGHETPLFNGLAEGYLLAAERSDTTNRAGWLKKAENACRNAIGRGKITRFALPEALRLQGTYEWLRSKPSVAKKWWQRSLALAEKMGQRYDLGMAHLEVGQRLGDREHLERAEAMFREVGAEWDLKRAQQALEKL